MWPYHNFENSQRLSNSTELQPKDIAWSSKQQQKQGYKSCKNPVPICISQDASTEHLLARCYWAVLGHAVSRKSGWWWAVWGQVGSNRSDDELGIKTNGCRMHTKGVKVIQLALTLHHSIIYSSLSLFSGSQGVCNMVTHTIQWRWTVTPAAVACTVPCTPLLSSPSPDRTVPSAQTFHCWFLVSSQPNKNR